VHASPTMGKEYKNGFLGDVNNNNWNNNMWCSGSGCVREGNNNHQLLAFIGGRRVSLSVGSLSLTKADHSQSHHVSDAISRKQMFFPKTNPQTYSFNNDPSRLPPILAWTKNLRHWSFPNTQVKLFSYYWLLI